MLLATYWPPIEGATGHVARRRPPTQASRAWRDSPDWRATRGGLAIRQTCKHDHPGASVSISLGSAGERTGSLGMDRSRSWLEVVLTHCQWRHGRRAGSASQRRVKTPHELQRSPRHLCPCCAPSQRMRGSVCAAENQHGRGPAMLTRASDRLCRLRPVPSIRASWLVNRRHQ